MRRSLALILLAACTTSSPEGDGRDDSVSLGGKADGSFQVTPAELAEMLSIASYSHVDYLEDTVGLSHLAAAAIDTAATGPDGHRGSVDDTEFTSLDQLDEVAYVGRIALGKLLDYVHTAGYIEPGWSTRWRVQDSQRYKTASGFDLWGGTPAFTVDREGALVALFQTDIHSLALAIDGEPVAVPPDTGTTAYQEMRVAVDENNAIHVFYERYVNGNSFRHMTYANGQWSDLGTITGESISVQTGPGGEVYALVRGSRWEGSQYKDFAELHHLTSDPTQSTIEALTEINKREPASLGVGADGLPVVAHLDLTAPGSGTYATLVLRRETPTGIETVTAAADPAWAGIEGFVTSGGTNATIMMTRGATLYVVREKAGALVAEPAADANVGWISSAAVDAQGEVTACGKPMSTSSINELVINGTTATPARFVNRGASAFCFVQADSSQHLHMFYGNNRTYLHATLD